MNTNFSAEERENLMDIIRYLDKEKKGRYLIQFIKDCGEGEPEWGSAYSHGWNNAWIALSTIIHNMESEEFTGE